MIVHFGEVKGRKFGGRGGPRKGSRRWVELKDGSIVKWWNNEWRFKSVRWNSKVATSLNHRAMSKADENGTDQVVEERYTDYDQFSKRMIGIMGFYEFRRMVEWIQG